MAKGNLLLGMGRGKLGDVVLYRQNGQQMSRPRVRVVKNPRTSGQQIQRMIQATIAYAYAGLKTIVDHSFEGVQYGGKSMNYFMKRNMDELRSKVLAISNGGNAYAKFAIPNVRVLYPNDYIVSNGSLPPCPAPRGAGVVPQTGSGLLFADGSASDTTLKGFMSYFGASAGDQLTFLCMNVKETTPQIVATLEGENAYAVALAVRRIKFKSSYTQEELNTSIVGNNDLFDSEVTSTDVSVRVSASGQNAAFVIQCLPMGFLPVGGCVILSRKQGEAWLRSPQTAYMFDNFQETAGFSLSVAYNAWMSGTTPVGVSEYILNGKPNTDTWPNVDDGNP